MQDNHLRAARHSEGLIHVKPGLHKLWNPAILESRRSEFGKHGEHGEHEKDEKQQPVD